MKQLSAWTSHGGMQTVHEHASEATGTNMVFSVFVPEHEEGAKLPVLWYLSGLTCNHSNVTEKGEFRAACAEHGIIFVAPDTSPRGEGVPDDSAGHWDFGLGAGFYVDATQAPYDRHYKMWSYVTEELPALVKENFPVDMDRQGITGHSMGGHGALTVGLTHSERFRSVSAFSPVCHPSIVPWGEKAFTAYLGGDRKKWRAHDAVQLIEDGRHFPELLVDIGTDDGFLDEQLKPEALAEACANAGIDLTLRLQPGYDHSYYFISTFMADHIEWHAERLKG